MSVVGTSSQNPRFSPPDVPGLMLWLDAADSRTVTFTGSNVSRWADKSGNGYTMDTAPSGCSLPIQGTAINGLSTVGINTLSCGIKQSRIINGITNFFWVRREVEGNQFYFGADGSYDFHTGNSQEYASLAYSPVGLQDASMTIYLSNSVVRGRMAYTPLVGVGNINLLCVSNITGETKLQGLSYDRGNTFRSQRCDWGEILLYSNALTRTQIDAVEGYLARRWGIPTYLTVTHPYRSGLPALRGFSPLDVPGLTVWLDAADQSTMTLSGTSITQWRDKSGNDKHATGSGVNAPVLSNASLNGLPTVRFNGASGTPQYVDLPAFDFGTSERTAFFVIQNTGPASGAASVPHWFWPNTGNGTNSLSFTAWIGTAVQGQAGMIGTTATKNTYLIVGYRFSNAFEELFFGGVSAGTATKTVNGSSYANATSGYRIGAINGDVTTTYFFDGNIGEVLIFNTAINFMQRQQVEAYLAAKWGQRGSMGGSAHPFRYGPAAIVPTSIPGCALWLDAADSTTLTLSGSNVTAWRDKSGNNRSVTVTGTPQLLAGGLNSTPVVTLTGGLSYFTTSTATTIGTGDYLMGAVWSQTSNATSVPIGLEGGGGGAGIGWNSGGNHNLFEWASNEASIARTFSAAPVLQLGSRVSGSLSLRVNGTASTAVASSKNITGPAAFIGRYGNGGGPFPVTGYIAEAFIFTGPTTVEQRQQLEGYLAWKWGLSSNLQGLSPNYARLYRALSPVFSPLHTAPCSFWLDGADQTSMTLSGSNVTQWNDKSGSGFNAVVSSNAYATLTTTGLSFNNSYYTTNYSASPANETFFTVFTTPGTLVAASNGLVGTQTGGRTILVPGWGPNSNAFGMNNSGVAGGAGVTGLVTNTRYIGVIQITGTSTTAAINGNSPSAPVTITAFTGGRTTTIGRETSTQYAFNGIIHELLAYTASLTTAQRQQVEGYLAWKWGLQGLLGGSPHPFKYGPWLGRPTAISGCALWLDATDSTTLFQDTAGTSPVTTTGQTLRRWNDKSGRGCNATQAGNAPTWNSAGYTTFTRTSAQNLRLPDGTLPYSAVNTAYSMFAVVRPTVSSAILTILCSGSQGTNQFNGLQIQSDGRLANIWFNNDVGGGSVPQNVFSIASAIYTGSSRSVFLTGSTVNTTASSGWAGTISNNVIGMESSTNNHPFGGDIGELIVYPTALSTTERQQIEGYLAWKWGMSATLPGASYHPYRAIKP